MDFGIRGRVAIISGGSKGMGFSAARMLAAEGVKVGIVARNQANLDIAVAQIRKEGGEAMGFSADMTSRDGVKAAVAAITETFGAPDIAVSIVQDNIAGDFDDVEDKDFEHFFKVYTMSVVYLAREVIPSMKDKRWGRFIAVGAGAAKEPEGMIHHVLANSTRPGAVGFAKTLSDEVAKYGITVNSLAPGWIGTDNMFDYLKKKMNIEPQDVNNWLGQAVPAQRVGTPDEMGAVIAFFCSELAGYVSGTWLTVDGGKHRAAF